MTLNLRNRSLVPAVLEPLDAVERHKLQDQVERLPAKRTTLPMQNDYARGLCFRGARRPGALLGLRFFAEALARVGRETSFAHGLVFEGTVRDFARTLDEARGRGNWHQRHLGEVVDAIENLDTLRVYLLTKDDDGEDHLRRLPVVAEVDTPVTITDTNRIRVEFNPALLRLLQFNRGAARTLLRLRDLHRLRSMRAMTMLCQLSVHRHLAAKYGAPLVLRLDRVRKLYGLEAERRLRMSKRAGRPTAYARWDACWAKLKAAADEVRALGWDFEMRTMRESRRVVGVEWIVRKVDQDFRKAARARDER